MPTQANLMGSGNSALCAQASVGVPTLNQTATGTNLATALQLPSDFNLFTTVAAGTGAKLPPSTGNLVNLADSYIVVNHGANALLVYPGLAAGKVANGAAGAGFSVAANKTAYFTYLGSDNWAASVSA